MYGILSLQRRSRSNRHTQQGSESYHLVAAAALGAYALLLLLTHTPDQGDTMLYVGNVVHRLRHVPDVFWEFGHPLWRPLAFGIMSLFHLGSASTPEGVLQRRVVAALTCMASVAGVVAILAFLSWLRTLGIAWWISLAAALTLMLTSTFLGFAQTGSSYIPALAFLLVGLRAVATDEPSAQSRAILQGSIAFALAVLFWFPILLAVPAAAASALILRGDSARHRRLAIAVCVGSGVLTVLAYAVVAYLAGVRSVPDLKAWVVEAGHGIVGIGGVARAVVGFARSIVDAGRLGLIAKRHVIHDPYNGTSWSDVLKAGLLRIVLLYLALTILTYRLLRVAEGRRALVLLALTALPVVAFAYTWQGGDPERYLALYPALFIAFALAIASLPAQRGMIVAALAIVCIAAINIPAISRGKAAKDCVQLATRLMSIPRDDGKIAVVVTPHDLDEILFFRARCPDAALVESANPPQVHGLVMAHRADAPGWRQSFADRVRRTWSAGNHIWIARRAFAERPSANWDWAEGDDPYLHWRDFPAFFDHLDVGPPVGGADGFVELLPTQSNREELEKLSGIAERK